MLSSGTLAKGLQPASDKACRRAMQLAVIMCDSDWPLLSMKQDGTGGIIIEGQSFDNEGNRLRGQTKEFRIPLDGSCARYDLEGGNVWQRTPINKPLAA